MQDVPVHQLGKQTRSRLAAAPQRLALAASGRDADAYWEQRQLEATLHEMLENA